MIRIILGAALSALAMFVIGFLFFATGLQNIVSGSLTDTQAADVQRALAVNLPRTGTYFVPYAEGSAAQTVMFGQGPIATIHYNSGGFPAMDTATLLGGFVFNFVIALLIGAALLGISGRVADFASRARVAILLAVAGVAFTHLSEPIYYHHDWPFFIYVFVGDALMLIAAGLILAKLLPAPPAAASVEDSPATEG